MSSFNLASEVELTVALYSGRSNNLVNIMNLHGSELKNVRITLNSFMLFSPSKWMMSCGFLRKKLQGISHTIYQNKVCTLKILCVIVFFGMKTLNMHSIKKAN